MKVSSEEVLLSGNKSDNENLLEIVIYVSFLSCKYVSLE